MKCLVCLHYQGPKCFFCCGAIGTDHRFDAHLALKNKYLSLIAMDWRSLTSVEMLAYSLDYSTLLKKAWHYCYLYLTIDCLLVKYHLTLWNPTLHQECKWTFRVEYCSQKDTEWFLMLIRQEHWLECIICWHYHVHNSSFSAIHPA